MSQAVKWRWYEDRDREAADAMHRQLEQKLGQAMDRPNLMRRPVIAAVVGEVDGEVKYGMYLEAEAELCAMGTDAMSAAQLAEGQRLLTEAAKFYELRIVRCYVPETMLEPTKKGRWSAIERTLLKCGFTRENKRIQQFFMWLV
jgi:hypothetical protein